VGSVEGIGGPGARDVIRLVVTRPGRHRHADRRQRAVDEAVPRIMDRLRPKYGRMYNFEDAQPINIRVLALSVQPSLTNR